MLPSICVPVWAQPGGTLGGPRKSQVANDWPTVLLDVSNTVFLCVCWLLYLDTFIMALSIMACCRIISGCFQRDLGKDPLLSRVLALVSVPLLSCVLVPGLEGSGLLGNKAGS